MPNHPMSNQESRPWYRRAVRWGQTNITELDATRYDIDWWRTYWRRTQVQGVIVNAGGIVAYYPSEFDLHYRAHHLGDRDLYGEVNAAARAEGLAVLARMDSNRATEDFFKARPEWFARKADGTPYRAGERYVACIFSEYYSEFLPAVLREVIERYQPDGFTDNSWSGLDRYSICYCDNCRTQFKADTGHDLPNGVDWDSQAYRAWIRWNYDRRLAVWDLNNQVTLEAGGPDCLWLGMNSGNVHHQALRFRDHRAILLRSRILMLDHQRRGKEGFQQNGDTGKMAHSVAGWDVLMPESMSQYQSGPLTFRLGAKPAAEARMWMIEGFGGGIQPWWHFIAAYHEDRRHYKTSVDLMQWVAANQDVLIDRTPLATVGVVWSQENLDFYGRDDGDDRVMAPYFGTVQALIRHHIPYVPIHADDIAANSGGKGLNLRVLFLPNLAAMSDAQVQAVRDFAARGGSVIATADSSRYTEWGDRRDDFALADLLGVHASGEDAGAAGQVVANWEVYANHSYLRLHPELRTQVDGPQVGTEPAVTGTRHPVLDGFAATDIVGFGGKLTGITLASGASAPSAATIPLTFIPPFPIYPPEFSWMREADSGRPALVLRETENGGRVAYLAADIDRVYGRFHMPDHGKLLANLVRWAAADQIPLHVTGPGYIDCHLYQQPSRVILHLVNLTAAGHEPLDEVVPVGPVHVAIKLPNGVPGTAAHARVGGTPLPIHHQDGWATLDVPSVAEHELVVIE